jgi:1,2-diacylglycerol 3-alpha-glucosyltransferase
MDILMMSNTYLPFVGGVERSIEMFSGRLRQAGHRVVIVVPDTPDAPEDEPDILRMPAIQRFNGSDFSMEVPIPGLLEAKLKDFRPDIVHSHHPFLIGDTALRIASRFEVPVVFTFHSFYEHYTHNVPGDSQALKRFVIALSAGYANLCDQVIAPSESVRDEIIIRGVQAPISVVPTGIDIATFQTGDRERFRIQEHIPQGDFVLGLVSRIAPEKNIVFLAEAVSEHLCGNSHAHFFLVGEGSSVDDVKRIFETKGVGARLHVLGTLQHKDLVDAYHACDLFVYSSLSETQGIVLVEAMAAGLPIVALDAPGVREVVQDGITGRLLTDQTKQAFVEAVAEFAEMSENKRSDFSRHAIGAVKQFTEEATAAKLLNVYQVALQGNYQIRQTEDSSWKEAKRWFSTEWELITNMAHATTTAIGLD